MSLRIQQYPTIVKAVIEMAYDNGAVNRGRTELDVLHSCNSFLVEYPDAYLAEVELELSKLTNEELEIVCCGDQDDPICTIRSKSCKNLLNYLFEAL